MNRRDDEEERKRLMEKASDLIKYQKTHLLDDAERREILEKIRQQKKSR